MDVKRVKTMLICFLLAVNLLLAAVVGVRASEASSARSQSVHDTVAALSALGANIDEALLSVRHEPLYILEEERDTALEFETFGALVGATAADFTELGSGIYQAQTGIGVVRISNAGLFEVIYSFHSKEFDECSVIVAAPDESLGNAILRNGMQYIGGVPVFNRTVTAVSDETPIVSGGLLLGETYAVDARPSLSAEAALLALAGMLSREGRPAGTITACTAGYIAELAARGYTTLRPVWRIETARGNWQVDALTLAVMQTS